MDYQEGYVAFIDILGFSNYVLNEANKEKVADLFVFVEKYCYLFNTSPQLSQNTAFFSDSIVIASDNLEKMSISIYIAESYLKNNLGLLFRGGITYGKYYYAKNVIFGPAVVKAYQLEKKANYSRILIDPSIENIQGSDLLLYPDIDNWRVLNPYSLILQEGCAYGGDDGVSYPDNPTEQIIQSFKESRKWIIEQIRKHKNTPVAEKYLWRIRPFNYTCKALMECSNEEVIYPEINYLMNDDLRRAFTESRIYDDDYE